MTEITSLQHPIVKHLVKLRKSRLYRRESGTALIVGKKLISELAKKFPLITLLTSTTAPCKAEKIFHVTEAIIKKVTGLEEPEPYAAEISLPKPGTLAQKKYILALDGISDPGNLGTLLRTSLALGWEGVFLFEDSADPFNEKALRAAKGATFHLPLQEGTIQDFEALVKTNRATVYLAEARGVDLATQKISSPLILVLGSEAHGLRKPQKKGISLAIPLQDAMESLNVAQAGAILLYHLRRQS